MTECKSGLSEITNDFKFSKFLLTFVLDCTEKIKSNISEVIRVHITLQEEYS